jgi:hypothetical protein
MRYGGWLEFVAEMSLLVGVRPGLLFLNAFHGFKLNIHPSPVR